MFHNYSSTDLEYQGILQLMVVMMRHHSLNLQYDCLEMSVTFDVIHLLNKLESTKERTCICQK